MSHIEGTPGYTGPALEISYNADRDVLTVDGAEYSGALFRAWASRGMPLGTLFEIVRINGAFSVKTIWTPDERIEA